MTPRLKLIVAQCNGGGIGINGQLPWRIKAEMKFFAQMTTSVTNKSKCNAVIMGRNTWESIPAKFRPLRNRVNIVLSKTLSKAPEGAMLANSLDEAVESLAKNEAIESIWIIGGSRVYNDALSSSHTCRVYLTKVLADFECDTFMPQLDASKYHLVEDPLVPSGVQEENGLEWKYEVWERRLNNN